MRKDFEEYLLNEQLRLQAAQKLRQDMLRLVFTNEVSQEQIDNIGKYVKDLEANFNHDMYIKHLLDLPTPILQKKIDKKLKKQEDDFMKSFVESEKEINSKECDESNE